jgi:hypothetical protein
MASFVLRQINPELWARVTAKAAAEGLTVKALVLKALAQYVALVVLCLFTTACGAANPTQATPIAPPAAVPASISLSSVSGVGAATGQVYVNALVKDASGKGVSAAIVTFTTTAGSFAVTPITADGGGLAQASLTTTGNATIAASVGAVSSTLAVVPTPAVVVPPPYVPLPTPPIVPPVIAPPVVLPPALSVSLGCTPGTPPVATGCNVAAIYGGVPVNSDMITLVSWDWGDGIPVNIFGSPIGSHPYAQAGTYLVAVIVHATPPGVVSQSAAASLSVIVP